MDTSHTSTPPNHKVLGDATTQSHHNPTVSVVVPCFNEELAVQICLDQIKKTLIRYNIDAEVIFVNNGSTDSSGEVLKKNLATFKELKVLHESNLGYGSAYLAGLKVARGTYIFMADCDDTYDFREIPHFLEKLKKGADLVVGNRFAQKPKPGVMPWHHQYIGNPLLSFLVKVFFKVKIHDIHCGARAIKKSAFERIVLYTRGMEFASEMIIKCAKQDMNIEEIAIVYRPRIGTSKLNSFSDGWRHIRFILLYSPIVLFLVPGVLLFLIGLISMGILYFSNPHLFGIQLYVHPMFLSSLFMIVGYELMLFTGFARTYAITHLGDKDSFLEPLYRKITIEKAGLAGILLSLVGAVIYLFIFVKWIHSGFGSLNEIKNGVLALTLITLGIQTFFSAFMFSILGIKEK
jgi:glycosyltransferase involved in cell wall biosynthesis